MKTLIVLILLGAAFLGGYYLGRQPDSPDVFGWTQNAYHKVVAAGRKIQASWKGQKGEDPRLASAHEGR